MELRAAKAEGHPAAGKASGAFHANEIDTFCFGSLSSFQRSLCQTKDQERMQHNADPNSAKTRAPLV